VLVDFCLDLNGEQEIIYDNCFLDKSKGATGYQISTIRKVCKRIACKPSMWEKLKYK